MKTQKRTKEISRPLSWFEDRVEKQIFHRVCIEGRYIRRYVKVENMPHAKALCAAQSTGKRYHQ